MATNKRKDAAALFELIDKSTLKVPKNAGQIKIPTWWSGKANPPAQTDATPAVPGKPAAGGTPVKAGAVVAPRNRIAPAGQTGDVPPAEPTVAPTPLFPAEGSQAGVAAVPEPIAPSIRPPAGPAPISAPVTPPARPAHETIPPRKGVFAPASMGAQTAARKNWLAAQKQALLRMPMYVPIGVLAAITMIVLIVFMVQAGKPDNNGSKRADPFAQTNTSSQDSALVEPPKPPATERSGRQVVGPQPETSDSDRRGKLYEGSQVQWNKDLLYIVIASYPADQTKLARETASFLQDHGVDVVLSTNNTRKSPTLITYRGFPSNTEAEAYRKKIVEIGKLHRDAKKTGRSPFQTAYAWQIRPK